MGGSVTALKHLDTVTKRLQYLSEFYPSRELYVFYNSGVRDAYTSRRLYTLAGRFANRLRQYGFHKGDVIANTLNNSPERVVTDLGIMLAGCVTMNVQLLLADGSDFLLSAKNSKCRAVVMSSERIGPSWKLMNKFMSENINNGLVPVYIKSAPDLISAILIGRIDEQGERFLKDLAISEEDIFVCPVDSGDLLAVLTTSGSTGYSKLVPRSHAELLMHEINLNRLNPLTVNCNSCVEKPFKYYSDRALGWSIGITFAPVCHGDTRVLHDLLEVNSTRTGKDICDVFTREAITVAGLLCIEMDHIREYMDSVTSYNYRLQLVLTGGQPLREKQMETFLTLAEEMIILYGSTEAGILTCSHIHQGDLLESNNNGLPIEDIQLQIVSDDGRECQPYETGSIEVKAPGSVLHGYFNRLVSPDPQTPKAFTSDGWFKMDDYGHMDNGGHVFIYGRTKDIIVYGGDLFYPGWMEKKFMEHPDILETIVVPVSDPVLYQNICVCVKLRSDSSINEVNLRDYSDSIYLPNLGDANTPIPKFFMITKKGFPETGTGKPSRQKLRQIAEEMFGRVTNACL